MTDLKRPYGEYRERHAVSGASYAYVSDGTMSFEIDETRYRERGYLPPYDSLPTKAEYEERANRST